MRKLIQILYLFLGILLALSGSACGKAFTKTETEKTAPREERKMTVNIKMDRDEVSTEGLGRLDLDKRLVKLNNGYLMPVVGLGTYSLLDKTAVESVESALKVGFRKIDSAYMYHNEKEVGEGIRRSGVPRDEIFVATKLYPNQYDKPEEAIEKALKKMNIEYIDLMLLHHPGKGDVEAYKAMEKYVKAGKIRSLGLSCYYEKELKEFLPKINIRPVLVQNEIHPYYQDDKNVKYIQSLGIVVEGWYPLGGRGYNKRLLKDPVLKKIAEAHKKSLVQIILRWDLQKGVVPIPGSKNPAHMKENLDIFDFTLSPEEMTAINNLNRDEKHDWY